MDYLKSVDLTVHDELSSLIEQIGNAPRLFTSGLGGMPHWDAAYAPDAWIFFGKESAGLPPALLASHPAQVIQIPMQDETRGLNLATSAGIVLYEALRQSIVRSH